MFSKFDGSGRQPRAKQTEVLNWIGERWDSSRLPLTIQAGVGIGKSAILRSAQLEYGGDIITPQNTLVTQYVNDYPNLNKVIGTAHYKCNQYVGIGCAYSQKKYKCQGNWKPDGCRACPFVESRENYRDGEALNIGNVMSMWHLRRVYKKGVPVTYIDEAHSLPSIIRQLATHSFNFTKKNADIPKQLGLRIPDFQDESNIVKLLEFLMNATEEKIKKSKKENAELLSALEKFEDMRTAILGNPEVFAFSARDNVVSITPLKAPLVLTRKLIHEKGILTSATLLRHDIEELLGTNKYEFYDAGTSIPKENRKVIYQPSKFRHNFVEIDPEAIVRTVERLWIENGKPNTVVHTTYALGERMRPFWREFTPLEYDTDSKQDAVNTFIKGGGVLVGGGISEGLDLRGDLCRLQIICKLQYPNTSDPWVRKRMGMPDSETWATGEVMKTLMQQVGRSTRGPEDSSVCYVLDPALPQLILKAKKLGLCPQFFFESIEGWGN